MEFGLVPEEELKNIDFRLPVEPTGNKKILNGKKNEPAKVYIGCAKWGREEWVGKIYPPKTKERDFLQHYVQHYNSIEVNATHYKIVGNAGIKKWADKARGLDFKFCPKMYQGITHKGSLKGKQFLTNEFFRGVKGFGDHLGPIFVQVSETFTPNRKEELFTYLSSLPKDMQLFLEVRHPDWFVKKSELDNLLSFLKEHSIGAVITDTAGRRDCAHMHLTIPKTFIRYVGNSLHATDFTRIDDWVNRMKYWLDKGIEEIFFFMHMHDEAQSPELTVYLIDKMNEKCELNLVRPRFIENPVPSKPKRKGLFK
jgi:uncharacterized protein YecE (DUF72 family)